MPFTLSTSWAPAAHLTQTSNVGGASVTLPTADAVNPWRPAGPSVVMMLTAAPSPLMASLNACWSTVAGMAASPWRPQIEHELRRLRPRATQQHLAARGLLFVGEIDVAMVGYVREDGAQAGAANPLLAGAS
jgi:hypothetical protein